MKKLYAFILAMAIFPLTRAESIEPNGGVIEYDFNSVPVDIDTDGHDINLRFLSTLDCEVAVTESGGTVCAAQLSVAGGQNVTIPVPDPDRVYTVTVITPTGDMTVETVIPSSPFDSEF